MVIKEGSLFLGCLLISYGYFFFGLSIQSGREVDTEGCIVFLCLDRIVPGLVTPAEQVAHLQIGVCS